MHAEMNFLDLFMQASVLVKCVMLTLMAMSVIGWGIILQKRNRVNAALINLTTFEDKFWSGDNLADYYRELKSKEALEGVEHIFCDGYREYARTKSVTTKSPDALITATQRSMRISMIKQVDDLEQNLPLLATIGSISPYVGLFGTVWGIMNSFIALGAVQNATLSMVAPGIAEALIATAMGLFAAIPAVVGYNRFSASVEKLENAYANFTEEFIAILHRQAYKDA